MSNSGFRGRGFGLRGARSNGPANSFNGPRFPHPGFSHPRPPRPPGPEKWMERPNFMLWQQNKNFLSHPQYRGNLQFRPNNRGRVASGRGIVRFSGPGRPPAPQYCVGFVRNPAPRASLLQEEQVDDKSTVQHIPLLGSEEERQQKITETADKLKQKLSSITEEELTNFWEDDLSVLQNNGSVEENTQNKGIPELRHEPPELDLTFTDFKDIGRVDCNSSKLENTDDTFNNDEILITFEERPTDKVTNDEIIVIDENKEESLNTSNLVQDKDVLNQSNMLENSEYHKEIVHDLPNSECNLENLNVPCNNVIEDLTCSNSNDTDEKSSDLKENLINLASIRLTDDLTTEKSSDLSKVKTTSKSETIINDQDVFQVDFSKKRDSAPIDTRYTTVHQIDNAETKLVNSEQNQNDVQTKVSQEETCQNLVNISDPSQKRSLNIPPSSEEIHLDNVCRSKSSVCPSYTEVNKLNHDTRLNNSSVFQPRVFNIPPRFTPRIQGPRCRWTFQQNGKNLLSHGSQRLPFHGNRMTPPRHITPFQPNDLVPVMFGSRAPPPFAPVSSHDHQQNVPFSSKDLPLAFDPSEPPPNIRSNAVIEASIMQPHPNFHPRGPPPRISTNEQLPGFNPQHPAAKVHKRDETLQPPPIFDPRLSSRERSNLITPLDSSRSNIVPVNLMETTPISDFNITSNFPQLSSMNIPSHQPYISNVQTNFQPIVPQTNNGQVIMREFPLLPPPINITNVPLPLLKEPSLEQTSSSSQCINMDDGLEDMQEAMEFAKQVMNMTKEVENENVPSVCSKLPLTPSEIPIPNEDVPNSSLLEEEYPRILKKQKKKENRNKKCKNIICGPELNNEKQEDIKAMDEEQIPQNKNKNNDGTLLTQDQIRPKVVFNLSSKTKKIHKSEEWNRAPISNQQNKETYQQGVTQKCSTEKVMPKKCLENERNSTIQDENQQKGDNAKANLADYIQSEQLNNTLCHQDHAKDLEKSHPHYSNNLNTQKNQTSKKECKKVEAPTSESMWKSRVISRFLKMSKNDICNMVNNSSLRKFDIAMKHLVKEKRPSLSLEMRNTEDEKMKEYDREEFMNQLNAMLDPGAVVAITDLPTEFIHHLSEVLQLDPMPFDLELPETQSADQNDVSNINTTKRSNKGITESGEDNSLYNGEEFSHFSFSQENVKSSKSNKLNTKQQQPLFNEADLDDILSEVTDKTRKSTKQSMILSLVPEKSIKTCKSSSLMQPAIEPLERNTFLHISNKTAADLDDIFSAGIARVKSHGKSTDSDTFRSERYERWNRKEQDDPDSFRNLTKEEWEAKYGSINSTTGLTIPRKCSSNSVDNLRIETKNKERENYRTQRYCSSDSPMRHLSLSPSTREISLSKSSLCISESEETRRVELSESNSDLSTTTSSDSDEEIVSPNVTKLLKVIKEKEKIAKKRSLNETIRDEVAAEIEKKWKEKSKYKERKSRKRERRKRDRKERRKRERKKRRSRNSYSDTSKSNEHMEEFRLLTENEIKKEVVVKEEPAIEKQQMSRVTCDITSSQNRNKPTVVSITVQPKTKAQLKQMPEFNNIQEKQIAVTKNNILNIESKSMKDQIEKRKNNETSKNNSERIDTISPINNSFHQINVSVNITEPSTLIQPQIETVSNNNGMNTKLLMCSTSNPITEVNVSSQCIDQKIVATGTSAVERKGNYKKIDIKAYKERALQKRLKEQNTLKENSRNSVSFHKTLRHTSLIHTTEIKAIELDESKKQFGDPQLDTTKPANIPTKENSKQEAKEKINLENKESLVSVQPNSGSRLDIEKNNTALNDSVKVHKNDLKSSSQDTTVLLSTKLLPSTVDSAKFKNIRSEGGKELKLKKEKVKKFVEKKKKLLTREKQAEKCIDKNIEGAHIPAIISTSGTNQITETSVSLSETQTTHSETSNVDALVADSKRKKDNVCSMTKGTTSVSSTDDDNEQATDQINKNISESSTNLKNKKDGIKTNEVSVATAEPVLPLCKELSVSLIPLEHTPQISIAKSISKGECETGTISSPDIVNKESLSLCEHVDINIEKENITPITTENNITSNIQDTQALKVVNENDNAKDNTESVLQLQAVQIASDYDKEQEDKSPCSPKSPFKGFREESIKENINRVSELYNLKVNDKSDEKNAEECSEQWLELRLDSKSGSDQATDNESSKKRKKDSETSGCNLIKPQSSTEGDTTDGIIHDNLNIIDNTDVGRKILETEDGNIIQEQNEQEKDISPMINTLSQDTFDENSEPFIVLDEYIDDADEKSIEKLNTLDLDLEDCVARDADIFTSQHLGEERCSTNSIKSSNFNSIDFKDLSEVLDKNNDREENQDHIIFTEDKEKSQNSKSTNSIIPTILTESPQDTETNTLHTNNMSLHDSVRSVTPKLSLRESRTIEDVHTINIPENNSQLNLKCFNVIRSRTTSAKSETSLKLNVPTKTALRKSLENLSIVGTSLYETNVEFLKSNKETNSSEQKNSLVDKSISKTLSKSNQREENDALHHVKHKSKMKHKKRKKRDVSEKMIKEAVNSDVVEVKHPNTKETILARMIEIDVEIHKLMTEKMTLYQMLTNDTLPTENNLQQNNVVHENKVETPSVLMSHLIQNLEPSPVTNQCAKRSIETVSVKDITVNSVQSNVSKIPNKQEHRAEKKGNCTSTCDSDEEEIINTEGKKSSTSNKKKKHRSERTTKKSENKLDSNVCVSDLRELIAEKRQANGIKSSSKKISGKQVTTEHKSSHNSINEIKSQEDSNGKSVQQINKEDSSSDTKVEIDINKEGGKAVESTELSKHEENCSVKNNENTTEISNKKYIRLNSAIKPLENKPLEKPLIYSDDSTWDTVLQNSSVRNQKKLNTGLALLEETYKKEMAKTRKIRVETRKKKKRKIQSVPEASGSLTPEEEELPLSTLCGKKIHKKKKLLSSRDQRPEETNTDQQLWRNVVEVINAVAENRAEQFHVEGSERQSSGDTGDIVPDITDVERDSKSKSLEGREDSASNDLNKDNFLQSTLCYEEPIQQNLENSVTSKSVSNLFETPISNNMSEGNMTEPVVQESLENNSIEIEDSNTENVHNINNISDVRKTVLYEEKADEVEELNLQKEDVNINTNLVTKELSDTLQMPVAEVPYNSKEDFNITVNKNKQNDSSVSLKKDDVNITSQEFNYMSQDENIINLKEQKDMQKVKVSNEENNNKNWASISLHANSAETLKSGETSSKRPSKRKRGSSKPPVRRSSRYTEEITKHIKLETDLPYIDQELQDKQQMTLPGISHTLLSEKEAENTVSSTKKSKPQKLVLNRKKYKCEPPAVEILSEQPILTDKPVKEIKKRKQYTTTEMTSCEVRLADCKHTILNPDVSPDVLQRYGISKINSCTYFNSTQVDSVLNAMQLTSIKNLPSICTKRKISMTECPQSESSKLNRSESSQPFNNEINLINIEDDNAEHTNSEIDVMPTLTKEPVTLNISQDCENPDIEIVEEKKISTTNQQYSNSESTLTVIDTNDDKELPRTQYTVHKGPILDIKVFENSFLAASEDGRIYRYNQASNGILNIYKGHKAAVTCLYVYKTTNTDISKEWMFSGSLDGTLRCYNITTGAQVRDIADIGSPVQCMDEAWGMIFIGTKSGHVSRYHIKLGVIKGDSIQFSDKSVLALKATNEGPRKVLIVASRSQPITIRDAQNGLFLRTICGQKSHTVYSLMRDHNLIYCGTSSTSIPVFDFTNGEQILQYDAGVGIVCMRLYRDLLFAGCYDGNIYVFNTKDHRLVCSIPGPGNMLLSMEIIDNKIIAGSKDKRLQSWQMPLQVRILL